MADHVHAEEAALVRQDTLMRFIRVFSKLSADIRYASNRRVLIEMALIRLCRPEMSKDPAAILERIRRLERIVEQGAALMPAASAQGPGAGATPNPAAYAAAGIPANGPGAGATPNPAAYAAAGIPANGTGAGVTPYATANIAANGSGTGVTPNPAAYPSAGNMPGSSVWPNGAGPLPYARPVPEDMAAIRAKWPAIRNGTEGMFRSMLQSAEPRFNADNPEDGALYVVFPDFLGERYKDNPASRKVLEDLILEQTGKRIEVRFAIAADDSIRAQRLEPLRVDQIDEQVRQAVHGIEIDIDAEMDEE